MNCIRCTIIGCVICALWFCSIANAASGQLGVGYGREFRENTDISQGEIFYRLPLAYTKDFGDVWTLTSGLEFAGAVIDDNDSDTSATGRLSLMPQVKLSPNDSFSFLFGLGLGCMMGETDFEEHNLGGPFFFSSKFGLLYLFGKHYGIEYNYYHQSNGGIYDFNAGLNMNSISLSYTF